MATQTNVPQLNQQSKLAVVPFPVPQPITQTELTLLLGMRGRLHQLQQQVEEAEQYIKTRLEKGAILEPREALTLKFSTAQRLLNGDDE